MTVSVLIPWRSDDPARIRLWDHCRPRWERLAAVVFGLELCVADDGAESGPFSRARAFNRAFEQSTGDVVVIWGADMLPDYDAVHDSAQVAVQHGWSLVFDRSAALTPGQTDAVLAGVVWAWPGQLDITEGGVPGVLAVRRDAWVAAGGMDERFGADYGYEDCALRNWLDHRYGTHRATKGHTLVCLYHPHTEVPSGKNTRIFNEEYADLAPHLN